MSDAEIELREAQQAVKAAGRTARDKRNRLIREHYRSDVDVTDLASFTGLSRAHIYRIVNHQE